MAHLLLSSRLSVSIRSWDIHWERNPVVWFWLFMPSLESSVLYREKEQRLEKHTCSFQVWYLAGTRKLKAAVDGDKGFLAH